MLRRALFVHNPRPAAVAVAERGLAWCRRNGVEAHVHSRDGPDPERTDLVVAVGGDGTLLWTTRLVYPREVPILAVHAGGMGFLSACDGAEVEEALAAVAAGQARVERRARLMIEGPEFTRSALNDVVVVGPEERRFTDLEVEAGGERVLAVEGDGVIVATPTGSTAYALAAGGPVLAPDVAALVLVPLAPHGLGARPVVMPMETRLSVRLRGAARVLADGELVQVLEAGAEVRVGVAPVSTCLVRLATTEPFFARLRKKLGWPA